MDSLSVRQHIVAMTAEILHRYRAHCASQNSRAQLVLPETLRLLPLYTLCLLKHPAFLTNTPIVTSNGNNFRKTMNSNAVSTTNPQVLLSRLSVRACERAFELRKLRCLSIQEVVTER